MKYSLTILLFFIYGLISAQDSVVLSVSPKSLKIGEQATVKLSYQYSADNGKVEIVWPEFSDTLSEKIEILEKKEIKTEPNKKSKTPNQLIQSQELIVTGFDSGYFAIKPIPVIVNSDTFYSNPILIEVHTVAVDTTKDFRAIKEIYETQLSWGDYFAMVGNWLWDNIIWISIILVLIGVAIYFYYKKKKNTIVIAPEVIIPAHVIAFGRLEELERKKLWQNNMVKEYYIELSDILREYIEERFKINALEQTSDEIIAQLRLTDISEISKITLMPVLKLSDLVKFAKELPVGTENEDMLSRAKDFISSTIIPEKKINS